MEVDPSLDTSAVASGPGSVTVQLHPLAILNISEHWTRNRLAANCSTTVVYGVLLGKQEGHHIEIINSYELLLDEPHMTINSEFCNTREAQSKQVYPDLDIIGWYTTGGPLTEQEEMFNQQMQEMHESFLILKLDPIQTWGEQLPIRIYESVVDNDGVVHYRQVMYTLTTDEAERIGVDYVARTSVSVTGQESSVTAEHLLSNYQAVQMLCTRLYLLRSYVTAVASGELPKNRAWLREISALIKRLSLVSSNQGGGGSSNSIETSISTNEHLYRQANDVCLASLLASLTQGMHTLHGCMTKTVQMVDPRIALFAGGVGSVGGMHTLGPTQSASGGFQRMALL